MKNINIHTLVNVWLSGQVIYTETDIINAVPWIDIIGLGDQSINEAKLRIRSCFKTLGIELPPQRILVNLVPWDYKKVWTSYDLSIALAIAVALSYDQKFFHMEELANSLFFGELWLDGSIKGVTGLLPSILSAISLGYKTFFIPKENEGELKYLKDITVFPLENFQDLYDFFFFGKDLSCLEFYSIDILRQNRQHRQANPFASIKGHNSQKRALCIAIAGLHNTLLIWPPGSWKSLLSKTVSSLLSAMDEKEIIETSKIYSCLGLLNESQPLIINRPFRTIHHTATAVALIWWGKNLLPWELSLSHNWVLFLDEFAEFPSYVLEVLRQPIEDKQVRISRANWKVSYPASFMLVATMNPCKCGYYKDAETSCKDSIKEVQRYQSRVSWPLLDRFDMILEVPRIKTSQLLDRHPQDDIDPFVLIENWLKMQKERYRDSEIKHNCDISHSNISQYIKLGEEQKDFISRYAQKMKLSQRVVHRLLKVARTIADIELSEEITINHLVEAFQCRSKTLFVQGE